MTDSASHVEQQIDSAVERQRQLRRLTHDIEHGLPVFHLTAAERERITRCLPSGQRRADSGTTPSARSSMPSNSIADI